MPFAVESGSWVEVDDSKGCLDLGLYTDTQRFLQVLDLLDEPANGAAERPDRQAARGLFRWQEDVYVTRAPGRLDVMGGIADYSGSLVLQLPLAEACHVALQRHAAGAQNTEQYGRQGPTVRVVSYNTGGASRAPAFEMALSDLLPGGVPLPYAEARALLRRDPGLSWAAYVVGALLVLAREVGARFVDSLCILVSSDVPEGKGVSSSAAVEVAAMAALAAAHGLRLGGRQLALLCQQVENRVVGAPCGIMDQMAATLGRAHRLLALRCQPAEVQGPVAIPDHLAFWGVDSGKPHSVGGSDYGRVRVGTFMGLRIVSQLAHEGKAGGSGGGEAEPIGGGYLANLAPSEFAWRYERRLPDSLAGATFLQRYGSHWDQATSVDPTQEYAVCTPASHPVHEHFRVQAFRQVLAAPADGPEQLEALGELMRQSHVSYSRCGLGADGTDRLVELVQEEREAAAAQAAAPAVFGAKITGGGSGGTVCILAAAGPAGEAAVQRVVQRYTQETGYSPKVFRGSSNGAAEFGHLRLRRTPS